MSRHYAGNTSFYWGVSTGVFCMFIIILLYPSILARSVWHAFHLENAALSLAPHDISLALTIGEFYFNGGGHDLNKSLSAYQNALRIRPDINHARYQIARIYFIQGRFNLALHHINKEIAIDNTAHHPYYIRGLIYGNRAQEGDLLQAEKDFAYFVEGNPDNWAGYNDLAWIQLANGKYNEARDTILGALDCLDSQQNGKMWLWTTLGTAYLNLLDYKEAEDAYLRANEISELMNAERFWTAYPGNNFALADNYFDQFRSTLHFNLGIVYEKLGDFEKAISYFKSYLTYLPEGTELPARHEVEEKIRELEYK